VCSGSKLASNDTYAYNTDSRTSLDPPPYSILALAPLSNGQLGLHTAFNPTTTLIIVQSRLNPLLNKLIYLFWCPPDEALWVKECGKVIFDRVEVWISLDPLDKVVFEAKLFDLVGRLVRKDLRTVFTPSVSRSFRLI